MGEVSFYIGFLRLDFPSKFSTQNSPWGPERSICPTPTPRWPGSLCMPSPAAPESSSPQSSLCPLARSR